MSRSSSWRVLAPNLITAASLCLGLASVLLTVEGRHELAAWLIIYSVMLDKADGAVARFLHASTAFGAELDSFADLVAFGVAPAMLVYGVAPGFGVPPGGLAHAALIASGFVYVVAAAVRLARFNTRARGEGGHRFSGVPTTFAGGVTSGVVIVLLQHHVRNAHPVLLTLVLLFLGLAMVSHIPVLKVRRRRNRAVNLAQAAGIAIFYASGITMHFPEVMLGLAMLYLVAGAYSVLASEPVEAAVGVGSSE